MTARSRDVVLDEIHGACPYCVWSEPPMYDTRFGSNDTRCETGMELERAYDAGRAAEREAVVGWLSRRGVLSDGGSGAYATNPYILDASRDIERGAHLPTTGGMSDD
jgi:hypothetical protein